MPCDRAAPLSLPSCCSNFVSQKLKPSLSPPCPAQTPRRKCKKPFSSRVPAQLRPTRRVCGRRMQAPLPSRRSGLMDPRAFPKDEGAGPSSSAKYDHYRDIESQEELLVPGMSRTDNMLRWGFIRKVYGIVSCQLILTAIVAAIIYGVPPVRGFVTTSLAFQLTFAILPLIGLIPLFIYARQHPINIILLGVWTACMSVGLGTACTLYEPAIVLEALCLTAAIVVGLTLYTFYAVRKGVSFQRLGPILFCALCGLVMWSFLQLVLGSYLGPASRTIFALLGALVFSAYIVLDTENLIARHDLDDYVAASLSLYLDIINLFLTLLRLLGNNRN